ncbi:MAG: hypothetical protein LBM96_04480 [Methanobrevibacter sp.]|jgi:lipopolysaccharide biosynthesis glycosyltransferase|nr:hypothetical protein [Candidatus Methanoflexus mossambicus]
MNRIPIVFITDTNFIIPTAVAITSLLKNKSRKSYYEIYIIKNKISKADEKKIMLFNNKTTKINFITVPSNEFKKLDEFKKNKACASISALLKFKIPDLIPTEDKIIYLDGDILVKKDLKELYSINIKNYYAGVVHDTGHIYWKHEYAYLNKYFNSGVMLLNLKLLRKNNVPKLLIQKKKEISDMNLMDQNVFNLIFQNKVLMIDIKFNFLIMNLLRARNKFNMDQINSLFNSNYKSLKDIEKKSVIIHFSSRDKPWKYTNSFYSKEWFKYFKLSPFKNEILKREKIPLNHNLYCSTYEKSLKTKIKTKLINNFLIYTIFKERGNLKNIYKIIKAYKRIKKLKLFDDKYYLKKYKFNKNTLLPLNHYIYHGYKEGKNPNNKFDTKYYLNKYPDVKQSNQNPLIHYVLYGKTEHRFINKNEEKNSS